MEKKLRCQFIKKEEIWMCWMRNEPQHGFWVKRKAWNRFETIHKSSVVFVVVGINQIQISKDKQTIH